VKPKREVGHNTQQTIATGVQLDDFDMNHIVEIDTAEQGLLGLLESGPLVTVKEISQRLRISTSQLIDQGGVVAQVLIGALPGGFVRIQVPDDRSFGDLLDGFSGPRCSVPQTLDESLVADLDGATHARLLSTWRHCSDGVGRRVWVRSEVPEEGRRRPRRRLRGTVTGE